MKAKNTIMMALAGILLIACKDNTYKLPTLDAMRSADKARAIWARETEEHPATVEKQISMMDSTAKDSVSPLYSEKSSNTSYKENESKSSRMGEHHQSSRMGDNHQSSRMGDNHQSSRMGEHHQSSSMGGKYQSSEETEE